MTFKNVILGVAGCLVFIKTGIISLLNIFSLLFFHLFVLFVIVSSNPSLYHIKLNYGNVVIRWSQGK